MNYKCIIKKRQIYETPGSFDATLLKTNQLKNYYIDDLLNWIACAGRKNLRKQYLIDIFEKLRRGYNIYKNINFFKNLK